MASEKDDKTMLDHIDSLVKEEEHLYGQGKLSGDDEIRLAELKVERDQYGDLLRRRTPGICG